MDCVNTVGWHSNGWVLEKWIEHIYDPTGYVAPFKPSVVSSSWFVGWCTYDHFDVCAGLSGRATQGLCSSLPTAWAMELVAIGS